MIKTKILFLLHLPPPVHGSSMVGASIRNSTVVNQTFDCRYINLLLSRTIGETGNAGWRKAMRLPAIFMRLLWYLLFYRPHTVYFALTATGAAFYRDVALVALLRLFGIKPLYHLHNKGFAAFGKSKLNNILYRFVFRNAKVMLLSKHLYADVSAYVKWEDVYICPNGIGENREKSKEQRVKTEESPQPPACPDRYREVGKRENAVLETPNSELRTSLVPQEASSILRTPNSEFNTPNSVTKILFLSNLIESKGVYILLEACSILKQRALNFECIFVGGEADVTAEMFNEKRKAYGLENNVHYLGKKYGVEKEIIFANADIFAMPTYFETFGIVNLEAMQYSLPVVSTYEGGIPDVVEDGITGYLVPQRNAHALADKLALLINDRNLRQQMGVAGRKRYEEEFTLAKFEKKLVEIIEEVIRV